MVNEGELILNVLKANNQTHLDGKACILEMKMNADRQGIKGNWKQMEWIGWYLEEETRNTLIRSIGGSIGPGIPTEDGGIVVFDYMNHEVWDIKSHTIDGGSEICVFNDKEAIFKAINKYGKLGFIVFMCNVELDTTGEFRKWHDDLKGEKSKYQVANEIRGASHRRRKIACDVSEILIIEFTSLDDIDKGYKEGWIKPFQEGMRNSNGNARRTKIEVLLSKIPKNYITYRHRF